MGILPLTFVQGENAETHEITGTETVTLDLDYDNLEVNQKVTVKLSSGKSFVALSSLRT